MMRLVTGQWIPSAFADVRAGERFQLLEPDGKVIGEYTATSDAHQVTKGYETTWVIATGSPLLERKWDGAYVR